MSVYAILKLFVDELKDLYSAESQVTKALPTMANASRSKELRSAFKHHLQETHGHIERLDQVFQLLKESPGGKTCEGMKRLLKEDSEVLEEAVEGPARDAAIISAAQRVERYEIAGYGVVRTHAEMLRRTDIAKLLEKTLEEEKAADSKLSRVAKTINLQASAAA